MAEEETTPETGAAPSDHHMLADLWHDHKTPIMIVIAGATMLLTAILVFRSQSSTGSSTSTTGTPTPSGSLASSTGVPTAQTTDSTNAYNSLTGYMQAILQQLQQSASSAASAVTNPTSTPASSSGSTNSTTGASSAPTSAPAVNPPPAASVPTPAPTPAPTATPSAPASQYITVGRWPNWNGSLWGIAQHQGITLSRIEQLNPQISNPNLIYPNQQVKVS